MASNMTPDEVKIHLRELTNDLFGPGYPLAQAGAPGGHSWEDWYVYIWFFAPNGPAAVYIDIMATHGGDDALRARPGFGTWR